MKLLAIDTATDHGVVGLSQDGKTVHQVSFRSHGTLSTHLLPEIDRLLCEMRWSVKDLAGFGVTLGPGSFTGLRVGLATIKALAWAHEKPVVGLQSLEVLAYNAKGENGWIIPMLKASQRLVFGSVFRWKGQDLATIVPAADICAIDLLAKLSGPIVVFGSGSRMHEEGFWSARGGECCHLPEAYDVPRADVLSELTFRAFAEKEFASVSSLEPMYIRPSAAESQKGRTEE